MSFFHYLSSAAEFWYGFPYDILSSIEPSNSEIRNDIHTVLKHRKKEKKNGKSPLQALLSNISEIDVRSQVLD